MIIKMIKVIIRVDGDYAFDNGNNDNLDMIRNNIKGEDVYD